jgi:hypothetical protein
MRLITSPRARLHSEWLDEMFRTVDTPYWFAVDSDMLFLGRDWLADMLSVMERRPDLYLLAAEPREPRLHFVEPVSGEVIDLAEAPSTWLFCVRTSLRDRLQTSFAFHKDGVNPETGNLRCSDTGGKLLADMRANGLRYAYMPAWYRWKYHHFGSLSWGAAAAGDDPQVGWKRFQLDDIERRVMNLRS